MNTEWLTDLWKRGQRRLAIAGAIGFGAMMALLTWQGGRIVSRLEGTATNDTIAAQTDILKAGNADIMERFDERFDSYDDSLKAYLRAERKLAVDTTLKPLVKMMFAMSKQIQDLQAVQRTTQNQVRQLPAAYDASLRAIIEEKPPSQTEQMMQEVLDRLERQDEFNARIDSVMKAKRKTIKVGM